MTGAADETWAEAARGGREALAQLGYRITPRCLPGEPEVCGATFAQHAMAYMATAKAIADHQLVHLGEAYIEASGEIYWDKRAELHRACSSSGCGEYFPEPIGHYWADDEGECSDG